MEYLESVIIGGGQAGLATSFYLKQEGREHIIFEKASKPANAWRNGRWDSFTLVTPKWTVRMPGMPEAQEDREEFMPLPEIINYFEKYIQNFNLPVKYDSEVLSVERTDNGYLVRINDNIYKVKNVVVATGFFQKAKIPAFASKISKDILQLSSGEYRNPNQLPEGGVLVVGSAQSGAQIAEELYLSGRKVYIGTGCTAGRIPRRYRGKDIVEWMDLVGFFNRTYEQLPPNAGRYEAVPHVSGLRGGHTLNLHRFVKDGVSLLGHLNGAEDGKIFVSPDLYNNLTAMDQVEKNIRNAIDGFIDEAGINAPAEELEALMDGYNEPVLETLDLKKENIKSIIWACGYKFDYSMIKTPVHEKDGFPIQQKGRTKYPGLFFVGLPWSPTQGTGLLIGISKHAKDIAYNIMQPERDTSPQIIN